MEQFLASLFKFPDMKTKRIFYFIGLLFLSVVIQSCKKDNPSSLGFKIKATDTSYNPGLMKSALNSTTLPIIWDTASIILNRLEFEAEYKQLTDSTSLSMDVEYKWQGNQTINLLAIPPVFATLDLPDGIYREIELKVISREPATPAVPNFYLEGRLSTDVDVFPIVLLVRDDFTVKTEVNDWEINSQNGNSYVGLIELSLQQVFSKISMDDMMGAQLVNGRIVISSSVNADLYEKILESLGDSGECHHEGEGTEDHDGGDDGDDG
jgi:hypothetical protein